MAPPPARRPVRVVIADDNDLLVDALRVAMDLHDDVEAVAAAADGEAVRAAVQAHEPDVVLMDLRLGGEWGLDLVPALRDGSGTAVVVYSAADLDTLAEEAAAAGVSRLVPKGAPLDELLQAIVEAGAARDRAPG